MSFVQVGDPEASHPANEHVDFRLLADVLQLSNSVRSRLFQFWLSERLDGESMLGTLVRAANLSADLRRTCELAAKGYVQQSHVAALVTSEIHASLQHLATSMAPNSSTVRLSLAETLPESDSVRPGFPATGPMALRDLPTGTVLGRCTIEAVIGRGGFGTVYRGMHRTLRIPVAVKVLNLPVHVMNPATLDAFRQEAMLLAQVNHPNVVRVWDFDDEGEMPYLLVEFVDGPTVAEVLRQSGTIQVQRALAIMEDVVMGLDATASRHIVHHDVKPANILLDKSGRAKITDFGLAAIGRSTPEGDIQGTIDYMAPEKAANDPADHRSDMYSLGVTLYEMLTGELPLRGATAMQTVLKHAKEHPLSPSNLCPQISPALSALVLRLLAKDPADRFSGYAELLDCLRTLRDPAFA